MINNFPEIINIFSFPFTCTLLPWRFLCWSLVVGDPKVIPDHTVDWWTTGLVAPQFFLQFSWFQSCYILYNRSQVSRVDFVPGVGWPECFVLLRVAQIFSQGLLCATLIIILKTWMLGSSFVRVNLDPSVLFIFLWATPALCVEPWGGFLQHYIYVFSYFSECTCGFCSWILLRKVKWKRRNKVNSALINLNKLELFF